ncbi:MAG: sensor domain-containing diguanylate cyclase [Candidatus Pacearchaeota archaeon]|nr:sensor domain-containing diguanylate cyclase [Candidatus Pacearchaeota archaeon]
MSDFFKETVDNLGLGVCRVDSQKKIIYWNKGAFEILGFDFDDVKGKRFGFSSENCAIGLALKDGEIRESSAFMRDKNGRKINISYKIVPNKNEKNEITGATIMFHDISTKIEMIRRVRELEEMAFVDFLTGLPNRRMFEKILNAALEEMNRGKKIFGIIFMDIDDFKKINDNYGHEIGDIILKMVSRKISNMLRPYDFVGRWGGEEFVALISHVNDEKLYSIASRIRSAIEKMSVFNGEHLIKVTLSLGATMANENDSVGSIISRADELMYMSKISGKNKVTIEKHGIK